MSENTRRNFLRQVAHGVRGAAIGAAFTELTARLAVAQTTETTAGFGPLQPTLDRSTGLPLLQLPEGFEYCSFGWTGDPLSDGSPTPPEHDGMAVIHETEDEIVLCRNHELSEPGQAFQQDRAYDNAGSGGCTNLVFDRKKQQFVSAKASLSGTVKNCAGGVTPWNSWLSCEETVAGPGEVQENGRRFEKEHGFVFDVPVDGVTDPQPIKSLGRFSHEALAVDQDSGAVYLTEDATTAGLYRLTPDQPTDLAAGGRFEMLAAKSTPDCRRQMQRNQILDVHWVEVPDRLRAHSPGTNDGSGVYRQGKQRGGLTFARLEGCAMHDGRVFVTATSGGDAQSGQVWQYDPAEEQLKLLFESPGSDILDMPDNMTVSPRGGILLCEDGDRIPQRMHVLTTSGKLFALASNNMVLNGAHGHTGDFRGSEWAGATFSADGKWLFANLQKPGVTFAITGPWADHLI